MQGIIISVAEKLLHLNEVEIASLHKNPPAGDHWKYTYFHWNYDWSCQYDQCYDHFVVYHYNAGYGYAISDDPCDLKK